jgi:NAD(P)-dependent dehydrogenase (short-subunit alcohol dehydrogenase family)
MAFSCPPKQKVCQQLTKLWRLLGGGYGRTMAVVLVTGGSSGIGLATVRRLAAAGDRVFAASRNPSRGDLPEGVTPIAADIADPAAATAVVSEVTGRAGRIDALVNNAGTGTLGPLEETPDDEAHRIFEVNFFGPLRLARAVVPVLREQGSGRIVNVSSMNDVLPAPFGGYYSASKAALASVSLVLDAEVHRFGIRVTVVAPGLFKTEMADSRGSYRVADGSPYQAVFQGMTAHTEAERATADPDQVAVAIEQILRADDPPARVVVGSDAEEMAKMVHEASADDLGALLRDFVSELAGPPRRG